MHEVPEEKDEGATGPPVKNRCRGWLLALFLALILLSGGWAGLQFFSGPLPWKTAWIERLGGRVVVDTVEDERGGSKSVVSIVFISRPITDADLPPAQDWPQFQRLFLDGTKITDEGLARLEGLSQIEFLSLANCHITDDGLKHLRPLSHLQLLVLTGCPISDNGLQNLRDVKSLRQIALSFTKITPGGVDELRKSLPGLNELTNREDPD